MANTAGSEAAALKARLLKEGDRFSFFQANRLLRHIGLSQGQTTGEVKSRPNVSLGFPDRDISQIVERAEGGSRPVGSKPEYRQGSRAKP